MLEYFVRPHICLSVWMWHFISSWVLGGRDMGLSLDGFSLGKCVFLKWSFVGGVGVVLL